MNAPKILAVTITALCALHPLASAYDDVYHVYRSKIYKNGTAMPGLRGTNAWHVWGGSYADPGAYHNDFAREIVSRFSQIPLSGSPVWVKDQYMHSLQSVVDTNRADGLITILCPFSWNSDDNWAGEFKGKNPQQTWFWGAYVDRIKAVATHFINQPDVWINVWNEPYDYQGLNYNDNMWLTDMATIVDAIRSTGNRNVIVIPGSHMAGSESVIITKGAQLLQGRENIAFDLHAYNYWIDSSNPQPQIEYRMTRLKDAWSPAGPGLATLFLETGPLTPAGMMDTAKMLNACRNQGMGLGSWSWQRSDTDGNALFRNDGSLNNAGNYNWGTSYTNFLAESRTPTTDNNVINPGFEDGLGNWTHNGSGSASVVTSPVNWGSKSLYVGGGWPFVSSQRLAFTSGRTYLFRAAGRKAGSSDPNLVIGIKGGGATSFDNVLSFTTTAFTTKELYFTVPAGTTWAQVYIAGNVSGGGYADSIQLVSSYTPDQLTDLENVAWQRPVTVSSTTSGSPGNLAVDGNTSANNSRWVSAGTGYPHWISVDLGSPQRVNQVSFYTGYNGYNSAPTNYRIERWNAATNSWITVVTRSGNADPTVNEVFTPVTTSRIRLYATAGPDAYLRLYELQVWGLVVP